MSEQVFVGIDVSKHRLDVVVLPDGEHRELSNDESGLAQLLESADLRRGMGDRARVRVRDRHSARSLADRLERIYHAVVEERRCAS